jgi:hypothetical protein
MKEEDKKLIADYFANRISDDDAPKLRQLLSGSKEARKFFRTFSALSEHVEELKNFPSSTDHQPIKWISWLKQNCILTKAIAASVVLGFGYLFLDFHAAETKENNISKLPGTAPVTETAETGGLIQLVDSFDATIKGISGSVEDFSWAPGKYELQSGTLHLRFNRCVDFLFKGPGSFEIEDFENISVTKGNIRTIVLSEKGKGFTIKSPTTSYIDWGTEFSLEINPSKKDKFGLQQGEVEIANKKKYGESSFVNRYNQTKKELPETEVDLNLQTLNTGDIGAQRNAKILSKLSKDPDVIGLYNFDPVPDKSITSDYIAKIPEHWQTWHKKHEKSLTAGRLITNLAESEIASHGVQNGCHRTKGRWPGSYSLSLPHRGSHLNLVIPGEHPEFTINFWLQKLYFSEPRQALIRSNDWRKPGQFSLEFSRAGEIDFHQWAENTLQINKINNQRLEGQWQLLSFTFGKEKEGYKNKVFINGNLVMEAKPTWTSKINLGDCTIGGFLTDTGESHGNLNCNIDEILILKRRWSEKEIKQYYKSGFPYHQMEANLFVKN